MPNENVNKMDLVFEIKIGSVVRLKSGGPEMTVIDIENVITSVHFHEGILYEVELPIECLALKIYVI